MAKLRHILAATDFSETSLLAVDRGFLLARQAGARYTVAHALGSEGLGPLREFLGKEAETVSRRLAEHGAERLEALLAEGERRHGVAASARLEPGLAVSSVAALAETAAADLVLVGARGVGVLRRMLLGSTASRLLRKSRCPVLVVRNPAEAPYRRALVAVDFSAGAAACVRLARAVAPGADLLLLHVFEVPFEGKMQSAGIDEEVIERYRVEARARAGGRLRALADTLGLATSEYTSVVLQGDPAHEILTHAERYGCDLVVTGKHGTQITEELLLGSVTRRVLGHATQDLLVVVDAHGPANAQPGVEGVTEPRA